MKIPEFIKKYWNYILSLLLLLSLIPLYTDNLYKALFITITIVIWNILGVVLKDFLKSSFLILLLVLPFNITYQLPYSIFGIQLSNPFINGVIVNYLIPTISILDLAVLLLLLSMVFSNRINLKWKGFSFLKIFLIFVIYLIAQSLFKGSFLGLLNSFRLFLYIFTFYNVFKNKTEIFNKKFLAYILITSLLLVIFQGILALLQFSGGSSVGLSFLGESQVFNGMIGSSFLELNGSLYLRGYGTFPHPNVFGGWLIFNMFIGWFLFEGMNRKRDYSILLMIISSLVLILTFSRIAFLVCLIIWLSFIIKVYINSKRRKNFVFLGLVFERVSNLFTGGDTSWSDRVKLIKSSFQIIKNNFLTGTGLGNFVSNMGDIPRNDSGILLLQPVHNIFLLIFSEIGLTGTVLFGTLLYFFFKNRKWSLRLIISLIAIVVISMFDHYLFSLPQGLGLLFLVITL